MINLFKCPLFQSFCKETKAKMAAKVTTRRSLAPDVDFPVVNIDEWQHSGHLLTLGELIGGVRSLVGNKVSAEEACSTVAKQAVQHWINRNVYPVSWQAVQKRLLPEYTEFTKVRKMALKTSQKITDATVDRYTLLKVKAEKVFDIYYMTSEQESSKKRKIELEESFDIRMGPSEIEYVENQLNSEIKRDDPTKLFCFPKKADVDPVWAEQQHRKANLEDYYAKQRKSTDEQFETVRTDEIDGLSDSDNNMDTGDDDYVVPDANNDESNVKKHYKPHPENIIDPLPKQFHHVRSGERLVDNKFYLAASGNKNCFQPLLWSRIQVVE